MSDFPNKLIAATRTDGLGGRLLAIVNAKCLADRMGCRFGFTWNSQAAKTMEFHSIDPVETVFSAEFIDRHWLGETVEVADFSELGRARLTRASLEAEALRTDARGWICNDFSALELLREGWAKDWLPGNRVARWKSETFRTLGFSDAVRAMFDAAGECRFPRPMVALHLRSGDVVRGRFRTTLVFGDKAIPSTLVRAMVSKLSSKGLATLLIGQDRPTLDYLKSQTGALLTADFGADRIEDQTLKAFFEMALMARCRRIYAGTSVFATIASVMGGVPCLKTKALFSGARAAKIVLGELQAHQSDYHPLEAAFGYQSAFRSLEHKISSARGRDILEKAHQLDPENDAYVLKMAVLHFREKNYAAGEALLKSMMSRQFLTAAKIPLPVMQVLTVKVWRNHHLAKDFRFIFDAAKAGHPYAAVCAAHILSAALGDRKSALQMATISLAAEPESALFQQVKAAIQSASTT